MCWFFQRFVIFVIFVIVIISAYIDLGHSHIRQWSRSDGANTIHAAVLVVLHWRQQRSCRRSGNRIAFWLRWRDPVVRARDHLQRRQQTSIFPHGRQFAVSTVCLCPVSYATLGGVRDPHDVRMHGVLNLACSMGPRNRRGTHCIYSFCITRSTFTAWQFSLRREIFEACAASEFGSPIQSSVFSSLFVL